ncbi:flagellar protein FliT [Methylobacillus flagellatus]|uniref:flagellar protein FliT n=1 Tax=Methylobacillus flagellatus TaxID=405 RepID=UPI0010F58124|nr:flagellar protein FliT [Methylobacillus flagellatus]
MHANPSLAQYQTIADITAQMLTAAQAEDWETLTRLEQQCAECVRKLQMQSLLNPAAPLAGAEREAKLHCLQNILAHDRQIRELVNPWMRKLSSMISSNIAERKLARHYGNSPPM